MSGRGDNGKNPARTTSQAITPSKPSPKTTKDLFLKQVHQCSITYDYSDANKDRDAKAAKCTALQELSEFMKDSTHVTAYVIPHLDLVMEMICSNIFRSLPTDKKSGVKLEVADTGVETGETVIDPAWPYLRGVYEVLMEVMNSEEMDVKMLKMFVTPLFVQELLQLFDSEEYEERDFLKLILFRLYAKTVPRRKMIRKAINNCFLTMIHETQRFNGASQLLEILASIISGFAVPLRQEHVLFFRNVLIPMHKVRTSNQFHEQLLRCSMLFLTKDQSLSISLVEGLLRYWPVGNSSKEAMFVSELQEVLEVCEVSQLNPFIHKLFKRIVSCMSGAHLQIADRATYFFESSKFRVVCQTYKAVILPMVVPVIAELAETHWHKILRDTFNQLKDILREIDPVTFDEILQNRQKAVTR